MEHNTIPVNVRIFGKEYTVACPEGEEQGLLASARRVDEEMRKVREGGNIVGSERVAVVVALNLAYELLLSQQSLPDDAVDGKSLQRLEKLRDSIDDALNELEEFTPIQ